MSRKTLLSGLGAGPAGADHGVVADEQNPSQPGDDPTSIVGGAGNPSDPSQQAPQPAPQPQPQPQPTASYAGYPAAGQQAYGVPAGQWYPAQQTPPEPVEPPEGWQAGYLKHQKMARWFMISTIVLAVTTVLAGMLSLGLGVALASSAGSDGPGSRSRMYDDRGGMQGFGDDQGMSQGNGMGNGNGGGQTDRRSRQQPNTNPNPTPSSSSGTTTTTPTPSAS